ncbi:MAG TPA: xanthine dehydrogenase family protein molybdopterin-binding subunit [Xanthobacteraceae bacterium]|nr:xanthine dehydrogenase family protein molybdopterin-binding subunit [Xanthobacteraceae bacterium]
MAERLEDDVNKFGIGQPVPRVEDPRFITGRGRYVDDFELPHQCYGVVIISPHAHARIKAIDTAKAKAADGVLAVLTGADLQADKLGPLAPPMPEDMGGPKGFRSPLNILAVGKVRAVGERVAFVVAETQVQARNAAELIEIDYEPLPAVITVEDAVKSGAPALWDEAPNNVSFTLMMGNKDATDAALANAKHVVTLKLNNSRITANSIETRAAIGHYHPDGDNYTLYSTSQNPHGTRSTVAGQVLRIPETKLRVISPDVGGGFGMKHGGYPEDALVVWASRRVGGRPVKWVSTRSEALLTDSQGRDQVVTGELALDEHGKVLGLRVNALHAMGSHVFGASMVVPLFAMRLAPGVYQIPAVHCVGRAVFTNTIPLAPYRGAGRPEATYLIEQLLDRAANVIGIDPIEIRRRNFIPSSAMPHKIQTGITYDSGDFVHVMDECLKVADWNGFAKRSAESKKNGKLRGRGIGYFLEEAAVFNDRMVLRFDPSGMLTILAGTHSHGQGHQTVYAQMVTEWLGVPFENVRFVQGDTDAVPIGRGSYGSRSMHVGGNALKKAADNIIEKAKPMAAMMMEAAAGDIEFKDGSFRIVGTDRAMKLTDVAKAFYRPAMLPPQFDVGLEASGTFAAEPPNYPNGCHVCEVEVDPETGFVTLARYAAVDDVGKIMNHLLCEGQIHGGVAQGVGQALMEAIVFDADGQLVTGSFQDYAMPRAEDFPDLVSELTEVPAKTNPLGVKGAGEAGATGAPPAVIGAILDALKPLGIDHIDMPATPARVWAAIQARATKAAAE